MAIANAVMLRPPDFLITSLVQLPVMPAAERPEVGKPQVMGIAGLGSQIRHGCEATNFK